MLFVILSFIVGYGISYGRIKYNEYLSQKENQELTLKFDPFTETAKIEKASMLDIDDIIDTIEASTGQNWYVRDDDKYWCLMSAQEDQQDDTCLLYVPKDEGMVWPSIADTEFIVKTKNEILPDLLDELLKLNEKQDHMKMYIESSLLNAKHTKEDYKKILKELNSLL